MGSVCGRSSLSTTVREICRCLHFRFRLFFLSLVWAFCLNCARELLHPSLFVGALTGCDHCVTRFSNNILSSKYNREIFNVLAWFFKMIHLMSKIMPDFMLIWYIYSCNPDFIISWWHVHFLSDSCHLSCTFSSYWWIFIIVLATTELHPWLHHLVVTWSSVLICHLNEPFPNSAPSPPC